MDVSDHHHTAVNGKQQRAASTARAKCGELLAGCATEEARGRSADLNELVVVELRSISTTGSTVSAPGSSASKERHHLDRYTPGATPTPPSQRRQTNRGFRWVLRIVSGQKSHAASLVAR
eukprot:2097957-Prymnesium_polylepis.1